MQHNIVFTDHASERLEDILTLYKSYNIENQGKAIIYSIVRKVRILRKYPKIGQKEEALAFLEEGHLYILEGNFKIIYKPISETTHAVTDVVDTRQYVDNWELRIKN